LPDVGGVELVSFLRAHQIQALALLAVGGTLGLTTGYIAKAASDGYTACANASDRLALLNSKGVCPSGDSQVTMGGQGPAKPSGVVSMTQYTANAAPTIPGNVWGFIGSPPLEVFTNSDTAAQVVGTLDESATDGELVQSQLGVCYQPGGTTEVFNVTYVEALSSLRVGYNAQTVSGVVGNLSAGRYYVRLCANFQTDSLNGPASVTIILAQTTSGVTSAPRSAPSRSSPTG
jgi:hypothetical protein